MRKFLILLTLLISSHLAHPETIAFKSGKTENLKIIEQTDEYIKVDVGGVGVKYYLDEIVSVDGLAILPKIETSTPLSYPSQDLISDTKNIRTTDQILRELGYSKQASSAIEEELAIFFNRIRLNDLKIKAKQVESDPQKLKEFLSEIHWILFKEGYISNQQHPHALLKLLAVSLGERDILSLLEESAVSLEEKKLLRDGLFGCSTVSQLGSILLQSLGLDINVAVSPTHTFHYIPLGKEKILLADIAFQVFEVLDLTYYYEPNGKYWRLKKEFRLPALSRKEVRNLRVTDLQSVSLKKKLSTLYRSLLLTDNYSATFAIHTNRGFIYSKLNDPAQSISEYDRALEINPYDASAYLNRGVSYSKLGNFTQAISDSTRSLEIAPEDAEAYRNRGTAYAEKGDLSQAIIEYSRSLEIDPQAAETYMARAAIYFLQENYNKTWKDVHKAQDLGWQVFPEFLEELRRVSGRDRSMGDNLNSAIEYIDRGIIYANNGNIEKAIADFDQALELDRNDPEAYYVRGSAYYDKGDLEQAITDFTHSLRLNPNISVTYHNRGLAYYDKGNIEMAIDDYTEALRINPQDSKSYYHRALAYSAKDRIEQAIADYNNVLNINPKDSKACYNRGLAYLRVSDIDNAIASFSQVLEIDPGLADAYNNRAIAYSLKRYYPEAWEDVHKAETLGSPVAPEFLQELRRASGRDH